MDYSYIKIMFIIFILYLSIFFISPFLSFPDNFLGIQKQLNDIVNQINLNFYKNTIFFWKSNMLDSSRSSDEIILMNLVFTSLLNLNKRIGKIYIESIKQIMLKMFYKKKLTWR